MEEGWTHGERIMAATLTLEPGAYEKERESSVLGRKCCCEVEVSSCLRCEDVWMRSTHRCQHYRFRVGNPAFRMPSRFPAFQLKCLAFCIFRIDRAVYLFVLFCAFCMFGIWSNVHTSAELARAKDIPGYLSSGKVQLHTLAVTKNTRWRDCMLFHLKFVLSRFFVSWWGHWTRRVVGVSHECATQEWTEQCWPLVAPWGGSSADTAPGGWWGNQTLAADSSVYCRQRAARIGCAGHTAQTAVPPARCVPSSDTAGSPAY